MSSLSLTVIAHDMGSLPWVNWNSASTTKLVCHVSPYILTPSPPLTMHSSPPTYPLTPYTVQHERMKFLCIGTKTGIEVYAWAQKPYSKFMAFKVAVQRKSDTVLNFTN